MTKEEIKQKGITEYYLLIDGMNDDIVSRTDTMQQIKKDARLYDNECDGEWEPILFKVDLNKEKGHRKTYIDEWCY